ncbi:hypothetical protein HK100_009764, partial [Physocladia obscura]
PAYKTNVKQAIKAAATAADTRIRTLTPAEAESAISATAASPRTAIAVFYGATYCPITQRFTPQWLDFQSALDAAKIRANSQNADDDKDAAAAGGGGGGSVELDVFKVQCALDEDFCVSRAGVDGYPTVFLYHAGKRVAEIDTDFLENEIEAHIATIEGTLLDGGDGRGGDGGGDGNNESETDDFFESKNDGGGVKNAQNIQDDSYNSISDATVASKLALPSPVPLLLESDDVSVGAVDIQTSAINSKINDDHGGGGGTGIASPVHEIIDDIKPNYNDMDENEVAIVPVSGNSVSNDVSPINGEKLEAIPLKQQQQPQHDITVQNVAATKEE